MKRFFVLVLFFAAFPAGSAVARAAQDLYSATVPVADYSDSEREDALRRGLAQVLVKKTGAGDIADRPDLQPTLEQASSYLVEFGYTDLAGSDEGPAIGITARYAREAVDQLLRRYRLPIWPDSRPKVVVWLVEDGPEGVGFISSDDRPEAYRALEQAFERRALPLATPLYDLEDQIAMEPAGAWRFEADNIADASERYGDDWLVIRFYRTSDDNWRGAWLLGRNGRTDLEAVGAGSLPDLLSAAVDMAVDRLAAPQTYIARERADNFQLFVAGVETYDDYNALTGLLENLVMVQRVNVDRVAGHEVLLSVATEGDEQLLMENLLRDGRLRSVEDVAAGVERLEWLGR